MSEGESNVMELDIEPAPTKAKSEYRIDAETAEAEFERFADAMDLDLDQDDMDDEDTADFKKFKRIFMRALRRGFLIINENGEPVYTPRLGDFQKPLVFSEPEGSVYMSMDNKKKNHNVKKLYGAMAEMTGTSIITFTKMKNRDRNVCEAIMMFFLA